MRLSSDVNEETTDLTTETHHLEQSLQISLP
jgi:hypothetical protein